jgi:hypothetical protein
MDSILLATTVTVILPSEGKNERATPILVSFLSS